MKKKYNLALIPQTKSKEIATFGQKLSNIADKYVHGENSLPHITLYQFEIEEQEIDSIWERVCKTWDEKPINLELNKFSCITFDNNIYWVSLLPNNGDVLHKMHATIAGIIRQPAKESFDPHLTLINTKDRDYEQQVARLSDFYSPMADTFILALGKSDDVGQLTEIVHKYK